MKITNKEIELLANKFCLSQVVIVCWDQIITYVKTTKDRIEAAHMGCKIKKALEPSEKKDNKNPIGRVYTTAEAAEFIKDDRRVIQRAIRTFRLQAYKVGRGYRIAEKDLLSWWKSCKRS